MGLDEGGQNRFAGVRQTRWRSEAGDATFLFRDVGDLILSSEGPFAKSDQVVREAGEVCPHLLRDGGVGPGALGAEFSFEFVEHFFEIAGAQVAEGDHAGRPPKFAGEELIRIPVAGCVYRIRRRLIPSMVATSSSVVRPT